jgi:hypothetical protein
MELRSCVLETPAPDVNGLDSESIEGGKCVLGWIAVKAKV